MWTVLDAIHMTSRSFTNAGADVGTASTDQGNSVIMTTVTATLSQAFALRRTPVGLLFLMAFAMPLGFSTWLALLNNFTVEVANFGGVEIGWLQTVREIPGFLAVGVILVLVVMREQTLALLSLVALGAAVAVTSLFPSFAGLLITTLIGSLGFHYYETVNQSLQLQWLEKDRAPQIIGWLVAAGSAASLLAYGLDRACLQMGRVRL